MIGSCMHHFGMTFKEAYHEMPYRTLVLLSASVPRYKSKDEEDEEKPKDIRDMLSGAFDQLGGIDKTKKD